MRIAYLLWCTMWFIIWTIAGFVTFGFCWLFAIASLIAMLVPIGASRNVIIVQNGVYS